MSTCSELFAETAALLTERENLILDCRIQGHSVSDTYNDLACLVEVAACAAPAESLDDVLMKLRAILPDVGMYGEFFADAVQTSLDYLETLKADA